MDISSSSTARVAHIPNCHPKILNTMIQAPYSARLSSQSQLVRVPTVNLDSLTSLLMTLSDCAAVTACPQAPHAIHKHTETQQACHKPSQGVVNVEAIDAGGHIV